MSVNKVILIGNLGKDPELRTTSNGKSSCRFPLATSDQWVDDAGQKQERTEWHNIQAWEKQAETCAKYLSKGRQVYVEGRIRTRQFDDKDGNRRYMTEIIAERVQFLGSPPAAAPGETSGPSAGDDEIPF